MFSVVTFFAAIFNIQYLYTTSAVSQYVMLLEGIAVFIALSRLPFTSREIASFNRLLVWLLIFEVGLGLFQLPGRIRVGDSELVHGTFPGNAEQYALIITLGLFYLIGMTRVHPERTRLYVTLMFVLLALIISIDNKASWLGLTLALGLILWKVKPPFVGSLRRLGAVLLIGLTTMGVFVLAVKMSGTLNRFADRLSVAWHNDGIGKLGKIKAYRDIARSWWGHPHMLLVGSGLGNFYSRSSRQFFNTAELQAQINVNLFKGKRRFDDDAWVSRTDNSMGGLIRVIRQKPFYAQFCMPSDQIVPIGSEQIDWPFSAYTGLLSETGLLGTVLYLSIWLSVVNCLGRKTSSREMYGGYYPLVVASYGMLVYILVNSIYGPWLETGRITTIAMALAAMAMKLERRPLSSECNSSRFVPGSPPRPQSAHG